MKRTRTFSLLAGSIFALAILSKAQAATSDSEWGDLGYSHPQVEALPTTISNAPPAPAEPIEPVMETHLADAPLPKGESATTVDNDEIATTISSAELMDSEPKAAPVTVTQVKTTETTHSITDINTVQNTYGVETEEHRAISFYAAPFAGVNGMIGNDTVDSSPKYSLGVSGGVLLSDHFLVQATYVHAESNLSNPTVNLSGTLLGNDAFLLKQNSISGGGRFFILGRESRVRPFVGGGVSYVRSSLNYNTLVGTLANQSGLYANDMTLSQYQAYGELGAEVAITRNIVANANVQISGVLSSDTSSDSAVDGTRAAVANSVSRTASYLLVAGLGIYF